MENTEQKCKVCYKCGYFTRYYTRGLYRFSITKQGFCKKQDRITKSQNRCDNWQSNYKRISASKRTCMKVLAELLMGITAIRQLLQEENEDE